MLYDTWLDEIKNGNTSKILKEAKKSFVNQKTPKYLYMLIKIQKLIKTSNILNRELCEFILLCCENISSFTVDEKNKYLKCIYFIYQNLMEDGLYQEMTQLSSYLLPPWNPLSSIEDELKNIYQSFYASTFNFINKKLCTEIKNEIKTKLIIELTVISLKFYSMANPSKVIIIENACKLLSMIEYQSKLNKLIEKENVFTAFITILCCEYTDAVENQSNMFNNLLNIITIFISNKSQISLNNFDKCKSMLKDMVKQYLTSDNSKCLNIFIDMTDFYTANYKNNFTTIQQSKEYLSNSIKKYKKTKNFKYMCVKLATVLYSYVNHNYFSLKEADWKKYMPVKKQLELSKMLLLIAEEIKDTRIENCIYSSDKNCFTSFHSIYDISKSIIKFTQQSFMYELDNSELLLPYMKTVLEILKSLQISELKCSVWQMMSGNIIKMFSNIINLLSKQNLYADVKTLCVQFCNYIFKMEKKIGDNITSVESSIITILIKYSTALFEIKEYEESLVPLALCFVRYESSRKTIIKCILNLKYRSINEENEKIKDINIIQSLASKNLNIMNIKDDFDINTVDVIKILLLELEAYKQFWPNKSCMVSTWKDLMRHCSDVVEKARSYIFMWDIIIPIEDEYLALLMHEIIEELLLLEKSLTNKLLLANMYCCKYQQAMYEIRKEIPDTSIILRKTHLQANDEIRNESVSKNVNVVTESKILSYLDEAVEIWYLILQEDSENIANDLKENNTIHIIECVIAFYEFHGHDIMKLRTNLLFYRCGRILNDKSAMIKSLNMILENIDFDSELGEWVKEKLDLLINDITDQESCEELTLSIKLSKSISCFLNKKYDLGYTIFEDALNQRADSNNDNLSWIDIRMNYLQLKYFRLPCSLEIKDHNKTFDLSLKIFGKIIKLFKKMSSQKYHVHVNVKQINQMFSFAVELSNIYISLNLTRETYHLLSFQVRIAHNLALPLRTSQLLNLMSQIDIMRIVLDDCHIKFKHMKSLLCLNDVDFDIVKLNGADTIDFLKHINCFCYYCSNIMYQQLTFECFHISIQMEYSDICLKSYMAIRSLYNSIMLKQNLIFENNLLSLLDTQFSTGSLSCFYKSPLMISYFTFITSCADNIILKNNLEAHNLLIEVLESAKGFEEIVNSKILHAIDLNKSILHANIAKETETLCGRIYNITLNDKNNLNIYSPRVTFKSDEEESKNSPLGLFKSSEIPTILITPIKSNKFFKNKTPGRILEESKFKIYTPKTEVRKKPKNDLNHQTSSCSKMLFLEPKVYKSTTVKKTVTNNEGQSSKSVRKKLLDTETIETEIPVRRTRAASKRSKD